MYRDLKWEGGEEGRGNNDVRDVRTCTVSYGARERVGCSVFVLVLYCLLWYYRSSMVRGQYSTDAMQCRVGAVQCVGAVHMLSYIRQLQVRLELHRTARHCTALHRTALHCTAHLALLISNLPRQLQRQRQQRPTTTTITPHAETFSHWPPPLSMSTSVSVHCLSIIGLQ